jgi:hypothetical protein
MLSSIGITTMSISPAPASLKTLHRLALCLPSVRLARTTFVVFAIVCGAEAMAEPKLERFGDMVLTFDGQRWEVVRSAPNILNVRPIGALAKIGRPIILTQGTSRNLRECESEARSNLPSSLFADHLVGETSVAGLQAITLRAHTRCRNATPPGVSICIPYRDASYVLTHRIASCRDFGGSPYSGADWFDELIAGIRFVNTP